GDCCSYTQESDMSLPGEWATEVEVTAAATPRKVACHCQGSGQQRWRGVGNRGGGDCCSYTQESGMSLPGEWATEVEVTAAAT
ncbi:hypothetical protein LSAT2_020136, partial [Lamellibrachia satsuma]